MDSIDELRAIVRAAKGNKSLRTAAGEIGISNVALLKFLDGTSALSVESCLLVARWLKVDPAGVLRLCDHADIADLFSTHTGADHIADIYTQRIHHELDGLSPEQKNRVVENVATFARALREANSQYRIGNPKKRKT